jgi:hypothetical protein
MAICHALSSKGSLQNMRKGRPTLYRSEFCESIVNLMAEGRSLDGCASILGVNPDSLYQWQKIHSEFSEAVQKGRASATSYWEGRLIAVASGKPGNAQLIQWALRNRSRAASGWDHAHRKIELSGPEGSPVALQTDTTIIDATTLSKDQRNTLRQALLAVKSLE